MNVSNFIWRCQFVCVMHGCFAFVIAMLDAFAGANLIEWCLENRGYFIVLSLFFWVISAYFENIFRR